MQGLTAGQLQNIVVTKVAMPKNGYVLYKKFSHNLFKGVLVRGFLCEFIN